RGPRGRGESRPRCRSPLKRLRPHEARGAVAGAENFNGTFSGISVNRYHISASAFLIHSTNDKEEPWVRGRRRKALGPLLLIVAAVIGAVLVYLWFAGYVAEAKPSR
ncbi:MAG: hypothetical protein ACO2PN_03670, partial [Pyrobaculum sp.]